jgi:hypothetical protein
MLSLSMSCVYVNVDTRYGQSRQKLQLCRLYFQEETFTRQDLQASPVPASEPNLPMLSLMQRRFIRFSQYPLSLPHVSYRRIPLPEDSLSQHRQPSGYNYHCALWLQHLATRRMHRNTRYSFWKREINRIRFSRSNPPEVGSVAHRRLLASCSPSARHVSSFFLTIDQCTVLARTV